MPPEPAPTSTLPLGEGLLYLAALVVFAFGCRTFENRFIIKLGWLALLAASYFGGWLLSGGSHAVGAVGVAAWFLMPWLEIVGRVRKLRFPIHSEMKHRFPPSKDVFPDLDSLSEEAEKAGFVEAEDTGWRWDETDHFMRLFYHPDRRMEAAVSLAQQGDFAFSYVSITSRTEDGRTFTSSNYPFSFTMKFSPSHRINRYLAAASLEDLMGSHERFLERQSVAEDELRSLAPDQLHTSIERDMRGQIDHNISVGLIEPTDNGLFRYSWRGCLFLWVQVVKDMIRV